MFKKIILIIIILGFCFAASPFFESSVYIITSKANLRDIPTTSAKVVLDTEYNSAFKYISSQNGDNKDWYKVEYYDKTDYDIWYKPKTKGSISGVNFQKIVTLYKEETKESESIQLLPTKRNISYDTVKAKSADWIRIKVHKPKYAYVTSSLVYHINRPYFLVELALGAISKNKSWNSNTRYNVLHGKISTGMNPSMVEAIKGEPDYIIEDKTGRNLYKTYWYGSQAVNFRYGQVTSWQ
ncbi:MAG: hypothetical protein A2Y40_10450 [Candidatus Margulisbacteria bacterium GWF2_35_9]|nr:MAG: hypothetical protein A2Y40_10450 [Candidatus Margulisbacteria bacterium GWF2_35_9]